MSSIPFSLRQLVSQRADNRCEYCGISQVGQVATFHIDHIVPLVAGGQTSADNLALACVSCSLRKGARQRLEDPLTGQKRTDFILVDRSGKNTLVGMVFKLLDSLQSAERQ